MYFRFGAMNCGKTTALLQVAHNYEEKGMNVVVIKSSIDKKGEKNIVSRLGIEREVDILLEPNKKLKDVLNLEGISCVIVDEVQDFTQVNLMLFKKMSLKMFCVGDSGIPLQTKTEQRSLNI